MSALFSFNDKIEFEVAFTCWIPNFTNEALKRLGPYGLSIKEIKIDTRGIYNGI